MASADVECCCGDPDVATIATEPLDALITRFSPYAGIKATLDAHNATMDAFWSHLEKLVDHLVTTRDFIVADTTSPSSETKVRRAYRRVRNGVLSASAAIHASPLVAAVVRIECFIGIHLNHLPVTEPNDNASVNGIPLTNLMIRIHDLVTSSMVSSSTPPIPVDVLGARYGKMSADVADVVGDINLHRNRFTSDVLLHHTSTLQDLLLAAITAPR